MQVSVSSFVNIKRLGRLKSDVSLSAIVFLSLHQELQEYFEIQLVWASNMKNSIICI